MTQLSLDFKPKGTIRYARLENSPRLQRLLAFLRSRAAVGATTREIVHGAEVMAVSCAVDELRCNGFDVRCTPEGRSASGANVYRYVLHEQVP